MFRDGETCEYCSRPIIRTRVTRHGAVLAAYAATDPQGDWSEDWAEVWTETGAGQPLPGNHPLAAKRAEVDQKVLANLLRLNHERASSVSHVVSVKR